MHFVLLLALSMISFLSYSQSLPSCSNNRIELPDICGAECDCGGTDILINFKRQPSCEELEKNSPSRLPGFFQYLVDNPRKTPITPGKPLPPGTVFVPGKTQGSPVDCPCANTCDPKKSNGTQICFVTDENGNIPLNPEAINK